MSKYQTINFQNKMCQHDCLESESQHVGTFKNWSRTPSMPLAISCGNTTAPLEVTVVYNRAAKPPPAATSVQGLQEKMRHFQRWASGVFFEVQHLFLTWNNVDQSIWWTIEIEPGSTYFVILSGSIRTTQLIPGELLLILVDHIPHRIVPGKFGRHGFLQHNCCLIHHVC